MTDTLQEMYREIDRLKRRFERFESGEYINTKAHAVFLTTPLTSTSWDGDTKTTADRAIIDLSAVFGVPAGIKAVDIRIQINSAVAGDYIRFGPNSTYNYQVVCRQQVVGIISHSNGKVNCDSNGDIYCYPSGTIANVFLEIWGYWT